MGRTDATTHGGGGTGRGTAGGTRVMRGHRSLVVCSKNLPLQEKPQWCSLAGGSLPPPHSRAAQAYSPRMRTRGRLGWGSALFPWQDRQRWKGESPSRTAARTSLLPQALPVPTGGWEPRLSQSPSTGNAGVRLKEYKLERETVHQLKQGSSTSVSF